MEDIARMADECMRDVDNDEDDSSLEDDEDLLVGVDSFDCIGPQVATGNHCLDFYTSGGRNNVYFL